MSQLLPVGDVALFVEKNPERHDELTLEGLDIYQTSIKVNINGNYRCRTDNVYLELLQNVRNRSITPKDIELLETRLDDVVDDVEINSFASALRIFGSTYLCEKYNAFRASESGTPMLYLKPSFSVHCPDCEEKYYPLYLGVGFKISVTKNLGTKLGITNGTTGTIHSLVYKTSEQEPSFLVIKVDPGQYRGKGLLNSTDLIPIFKERNVDWCKHKQEFITVTEYPLKLGYALTYHKVGINIILLAHKLYFYNLMQACYKGSRNDIESERNQF
ncbi:unnamed protein product [Orchesella dallaii]|uniref:Uncharacterized protein n=1 Tax=Orchesella dallaii TaxID=48710 RepID=A0ABP1RM20_9HEXA